MSSWGVQFRLGGQGSRTHLLWLTSHSLKRVTMANPFWLHPQEVFKGCRLLSPCSNDVPCSCCRSLNPSGC
eukprot:3846804-Amphidinium_carterae.1